jgi:D-beta-D-heptose 7-phosphate kinase/D-beta-D-heptose 1-phosphate adenosyltransferase
MMLDHYVTGVADRLSPEAPVPILSVEGDSWSPGGAANVAVNLKTLGPLVEVIGLIGRDPSGDRLQNLLAQNNIIFDEQFRDPSVQTIYKTRIVAGRHQICRVDREGEPDSYAIGKNSQQMERIEAALHMADVLIFSDYGKGTLTQDFVDQLIKAARANNCFIAADPKPSRPIRFTGVDLLTPNAQEARAMAGLTSGTADWGAICKKIYAAHAPKYLIITVGGDGMLISKVGQAPRKVPTCAQVIYDGSGAGDTAIAALSSALATGHDAELAARFANIAAGIVVGKFGTATATPAEILNGQRGSSAP